MPVLVFQFLLVFNWVQYKPLTLGKYVYPMWANTIGWCLAVAPVAAVPITMISKFLFTAPKDLSFCDVGVVNCCTVR